MKRPDVTHTTGGEPISEVEVIGRFAIGKARSDWLLGYLVDRVESTELIADTREQPALEARRTITELDWEQSCTERVIRASALESEKLGVLTMVF